MTKGRLEAFTDAVVAIIMTIMVLELVPPHEPTVRALLEQWPVFLAYFLSFMMLAVWWNNHHHLLQAARTVSGNVLWANMLLLFWLSLVPFVTAWMGETQFASLPMAAYGVVLILAAFSYAFLVSALLRAPGQNPTLSEALADNSKGIISPIVYAVAVAVAFVAPYVSLVLYLLVALMWIVPDSRIERRFKD
jgi:uncharacterized membrane protein